jgi:hypothetical protein
MRRQLLVIGLLYALLAGLFAVLAGYGVNESVTVGLPLVVAGLGAAAGSLLIVYGAVTARSSTVDDNVLRRAVRTANRGRLVIAGAGAACALLGAWLSGPMGVPERDLLTGVALAAGLGLAVFALLADNVGRLVGRAGHHVA